MRAGFRGLKYAGANVRHMGLLLGLTCYCDDQICDKNEDDNYKSYNDAENILQAFIVFRALVGERRGIVHLNGTHACVCVVQIDSCLRSDYGCHRLVIAIVKYFNSADLYDVAVLKFLFSDRYVVYTCSICAVVIPEDISGCVTDEIAVVSADSRIFDTNITLFHTAHGMDILCQFKGFSSELF